MSEHDVYEDDMSIKRISDADVERLLTGRAPESQDLSMLGSVLAAVHGVETVEPSEEQVARFASEAAAIARSSVRPEATPERVPRRRTRRVALPERLAVVAVAVFVLAGLTGIAAAADAAAPGDPLYGIDRALERVGINDGAAEERLAEAETLAGRGEVTEAMGHAASAIEEPSENETAASASEAATALREAAVSVESGDEGPDSEEVRSAVSAMLAEMAALLGEPDLDGAEFGRRVSEMARSIAGRDDPGDDPADENAPDDSQRGRPDETGPPAETPGGGPPDEAPGGPPGGAGGGAGGGPGGGPPSDTPGQGGPPAGAGRP